MTTCLSPTIETVGCWDLDRFYSFRQLCAYCYVWLTQFRLRRTWRRPSRIELPVGNICGPGGHSLGLRWRQQPYPLVPSRPPAAKWFRGWRCLGPARFFPRFPGSGATGMDAPVGLLVDQYGSLWVIDSSHNWVLQFDNASTPFNGNAANGILGQLNFDSHLTGPAQDDRPKQIEHRTGRFPLYSQRYNNRIVSISLPPKKKFF